MKFLINELEFNNDENGKEEVGMDSKKYASGTYEFVGTIDSRAQADKLIKLLKETKFSK